MPQQIPMLEQTEHNLNNLDKLVTPSSTTTNAPSTKTHNSLEENEDYFAPESGSGEIS